MLRFAWFTVRLFLPIFLLAVLVGRSAHDPRHRHSAVSSLSGFGLLRTEEGRRGFGLVDADTGMIRQLELSKSDQLELASVAPWADAAGRREVVGRWVLRSGEDHEVLRHEFGLLRYDLGSEEVIDRSTIDVIPISPPCWIPGHSSRFLFVGGDGRIHRYAFEDVEGRELDASRRRLETMAWRCLPPGGSEPQFTDLCWPSIRGFERTMIVAMSVRSEPELSGGLTNSQLWSLRLDAEGKVIEAVEPLRFEPDAIDPRRSHRRPSVGIDGDGRYHLAYLEQSPDGRGTCLRHARLSLPSTKDEVLFVEDSRVVAERCGPLAPTFNTRGDHLTFARLGSNGEIRLERVRIESSMDTGSVASHAAQGP